MLKKVITKYWREVLILALLIACAMSVRTCKQNSDTVGILSAKADSSYLKATYYRGKNGELIGQVNTHELTIKNLKELGDQLGFDNAALRDQVGKLNRLVAHWQGKAGMRDTIYATLTDTVYVDSTGIEVAGRSFKWNNQYLFINGLVMTDNVQLSYLYEVDFSLTAYRKPQMGFWKPPGQLVADIKFSDPKFRVTEFKGFVVTEPRKRWYETKGAAIGFGAILGFYLGTR